MPRRKNTAIKSYKLKSGKKKYMFKLYLGMKGGKKVETTRRGFDSYEEANAVYKKMAAEDAQDFVKEKQITFDQLYTKWLSFYRKDVKPSTLWKTETLYKVHLKDQFGDQYIDQITTAEIADYFLELSTKFVNYKMPFWYMRRIFEYAIDINLLNRNPARASLLPKKRVLKRDVIPHITSIQQNKFMTFLMLLKNAANALIFISQFLQQPVCVNVKFWVLNGKTSNLIKSGSMSNAQPPMVRTVSI